MSVERFFRSALRVFREEVTESGSEEVIRFHLAGRPIELHCVGRQLARLVSLPFAHLPKATATQESGLTVFIWDEKSASKPLPPRPWPTSANTPRGEIKGYQSSRFRAAHGRGHLALSLLDRETRQALYCHRSFEQTPQEFWSKPLLTILNWWAHELECQLLHAAAVGLQGEAVLLAGPSGSGKSTTALTCLLAGLDYLGDDHCLVAPSPHPKVYSLYSAVSLDRDPAQDYPQLPRAPLFGPRQNGGKCVFHLASPFSAQMRENSDLKALFLPKLEIDAPTRLEPVGAGEALRILASSFILQMPGAGQHDLKNVSALLRHVPAFRLLLGKDGKAPEIIRDYLEEKI